MSKINQLILRALKQRLGDNLVPSYFESRGDLRAHIHALRQEVLSRHTEQEILGSGRELLLEAENDFLYLGDAS